MKSEKEKKTKVSWSYSSILGERQMATGATAAKAALPRGDVPEKLMRRVKLFYHDQTSKV